MQALGLVLAAVVALASVPASGGFAKPMCPPGSEVKPYCEHGHHHHHHPPGDEGGDATTYYSGGAGF